MAILAPCETDEETKIQEAKIKACDDYFYQLEKPRNFRSDDPQNVLIKFENSFQEMLSALEMNGFGVENVTVMQLYSRIKYLKRINTINKDGNKRTG